jgi:flagellar hook-associated protein 1 FlgK
MSLSAALSTAVRSLDIFALGIQVAGHNIANASTPGYVRDELSTHTAAPYRVGSIIVGAGAVATGVRQQLDGYLEQRIRVANTDYAASSARHETYQQLQSILQELGGEDFSTSLNNFLAAIQAVVNQPDDAALRSQLVQQGARLATDARGLRLRIDELRATQTQKIQSLVDEANGLIRQIAELNPQITRLESNGLDTNDAGGLRIQRLNALQRLSEIIPLHVQELPSGGVELFSNNEYLLLGSHYQLLETNIRASDTGAATTVVQTTQTRALVGQGGGEIGGWMEGRDQILGGFLAQFDQLLGGVIHEVNRIHSSGEGLRGYASVTGSDAVNSTTAALNAAGLSFSPAHGSFQLKVQNLSTGATAVSSLAIDLDGIGTDTSLEDLRAALDALDNVSAVITSDGRLKLTAAEGFELRFGADTSGVLAALGINTFFTGSNSGNVAVQTDLLQDSRYLATGRGGGRADNSNAVLLAQFLDKPLDRLNGRSAQSFHTALIGSLAQSAAGEEALSRGYESFRDGLKVQREQRSGVSLDEEAIRVLQLQRNYQAAARVLSTIDQLLNTLLNI